jgi:hypothetical protein
MGGTCSIHGRDEKFVPNLVLKPEWRGPFGRLMRIGRIILKWAWRKQYEGLDWVHRIGSSSELLWARQWTFRFHKRRWISWLAAWLLPSKGLCSMDLVIRNFTWFESERPYWLSLQELTTLDPQIVQDRFLSSPFQVTACCHPLIPFEVSWIVSGTVSLNE